MVFSRIKSVLLRPNIVKSRLKTIVRHSHGSWNYRKTGPPPSTLIEFLASITQGTMWWWIMWHFFTEHGHVTGEWEYPNASKWSDEELGIPPDDVDDSEYFTKEVEDVVTAVAEHEPPVTEESCSEPPKQKEEDTCSTK